MRTAVVAATTAAGFAIAYFSVSGCRGDGGTFTDACNGPIVASSAGGLLIGILLTRDRWITVLPRH